jgi:hypothetical protein
MTSKKPWERMSETEKIEELPDDIQCIKFRVRQLDDHSNLLEKAISKIVGDVHELKSQTQRKKAKRRPRAVPNATKPRR